MFKSIEWTDNHIRILDQTYLPGKEVYVDLYTEGQIWEAIKKLRVRGAPAIGIAGAYGLYLGISDISSPTFSSFWGEVQRISDYLNSSRPTAVNLSWALERVKNTLFAHKEEPLEILKEIALKTAITIHDEDRRMCKQIGVHGLDIIPQKAQILTHCNTGGLATSEYGTALSVITHAYQSSKDVHVWVDETRPLLQGSRLTAWELQKAEVPAHIVTDSMAGWLMQQGKVDLVIVGADRVTANGDTANKIGTYSLAVLANAHNIPFYVALPSSTIDMNLEKGADIPIEERGAEEITQIKQQVIAPKKATVYNPAFDVTPYELVTAFITEKGVITPNYSVKFSELMS